MRPMLLNTSVGKLYGSLIQENLDEVNNQILFYFISFRFQLWDYQDSSFWSDIPNSSQFDCTANMP